MCGVPSNVTITAQHPPDPLGPLSKAPLFLARFTAKGSPCFPQSALNLPLSQPQLLSQTVFFTFLHVASPASFSFPAASWKAGTMSEKSLYHLQTPTENYSVLRSPCGSTG